MVSDPTGEIGLRSLGPHSTASQHDEVEGDRLMEVYEILESIRNTATLLDGESQVLLESDLSGGCGLSGSCKDVILQLLIIIMVESSDGVNYIILLGRHFLDSIECFHRLETTIDAASEGVSS